MCVCVDIDGDGDEMINVSSSSVKRTYMPAKCLTLDDDAKVMNVASVCSTFKVMEISLNRRRMTA